MDTQPQTDLQQQFEAAVTQVDGLPGDKAAAHMTELYGLYKQATEGDHDTSGEQVSTEAHDQPSGQPGLSQAQWDSWSKYKGVPEDEAKRQYVARVNEIAGTTGAAVGSAVTPPTDTNTTTSSQADSGPGVSQGGLRGDITAGAPYGGEDQLKGQQ